MASLIGKGARPRYNANAALLMHSGGHDADLALLWGDDAGAVRPDQPGLVLPH